MVQRGSYENQSVRKQIDHVTARIKFPNVRPLIPDIPPGLGIPPPTDIEYVEQQYLPYLMEDEVAENEQYTYGTSIKPQLNELIAMLKRTPGTNQACMTIGSPKSIFLEDPECLRILDWTVLDGTLNVVVYFRSNDLGNAWSANLAGIQLLKEYICQETELQDGEIIYTSKGLHLYDFSWDITSIRLGSIKSAK
jgi:thymidylate synthase